MDPNLGPQQLPNGLIPFGEEANCTLALCPLEASILQYQPSQAASGTFIAIFALLMIIHAGQGTWTRSWGFMACMVCGCVLEIAGYIGRLIIHDNPFDFNGFIMQIGLLYLCISIEGLHANLYIQSASPLHRFSSALRFTLYCPKCKWSPLKILFGAFSESKPQIADQPSTVSNLPTDQSLDSGRSCFITSSFLAISSLLSFNPPVAL